MQGFSNLRLKTIYITQDASHLKQSKQNHTCAVSTSPLGDILEKKVDLTSHVAKNHEILLTFNIFFKKNNKSKDIRPCEFGNLKA